MSLIEKIRALKKEKNAVVLGHNYMSPEVYYGVSDFVGDSLGLARQAAKTDADRILFNGVYFMAETASILNPDKIVLIADPGAGCSLVENITGMDVIALKKKHPGAPVVTYVNSSADVKAESDVCCTSANALQVVESLKENEVIFIPDAYLAANVQKQTSKTIIPWEPGHCMVHKQFKGSDIREVRKQYENLLVIAHPECPVEVTEEADFSGSTSQMETMIREHSNQNIFLVTECSMSENLRPEFPERNLISMCQVCPHMKLITLDKIYDSLLHDNFQVQVPEEIRLRAKVAVDRMLAIG